MTTAIEDNQLNAELQEFYLLSKHWISDLEFLEIDFIFLKKFVGKTLTTLIKRNDFEKIDDILSKTANIDKDQAKLKSAVPGHLHRLEQLINKCDQNFEISLIETHIELEQQLNQALLDLKSVKKIVFDLAKVRLKEDSVYL